MENKPKIVSVSNPISQVNNTQTNPQAVIIPSNPEPETQSSTETVIATPSGDFDKNKFASIQNLVSRKASQLDELRNQVKELNESLKNMLTNDSKLSDAEKKVKENRKEVNKRKKEINNSPEAQSIKRHLRELKEDMADIEDSLSTQLLNLYQITGVKEFETNTGEVREFVIKAKIKAKKAKKN